MSRFPILAALLLGAVASHYAQAAPQLTPCTAAGGPGAQCGTLDVPLDRQDATQGTIGIAYAVYPHTDTAAPAAGTVVLLDGGPGYASAYPNSFNVAPFISDINTDHDVVLIDQRGTGNSSAIHCPGLQATSDVPYTDAAVRPLFAECAASLKQKLLLFGTAAAADDIDDVRAALGVSHLDVYGVSYGTLLAETYLYRHAQSVRSLVLDSSYPLYGPVWAQDLSESFVSGYRALCARDSACNSSGIDPVTAVGSAVQALRGAPVTGPVVVDRKTTQQITVTAADVAELAQGAGSDFVNGYRELAAASTQAAQGDPQPLLRLWADYLNNYSGNGSAKVYSAGQDAAVICRDYPEPFDVTASVAVRESQYEAAKKQLSPTTFGIFSKAEWLDAYELGGSGGCTDWVSLPVFDPPLPQNPTFASVPTLFLQGDADTSTSLSGAQQLAEQFPGAQFVTVKSVEHDLLEYDVYCGPVLAADFIRTHVAPELTCINSGRASTRLVPSYSTTAAGLVPAVSLPGDHSNKRDREVAAAAVATVGEGLYENNAHWNPVLRGGHFTAKTDGNVTTLKFKKAQFVSDVTVDGTMSITDPQDGTTQVTADFTVTDTAGASSGTLQTSYGDRFDLQSKIITVSGTLGGRSISVSAQAP